MDIITGLMCVTVAIVSALFIYFILVPSMKVKSYDEVKAEQKKKAEEYLAQGRSAKEKAKDKKLKKAGKKVKEKTNSESVEFSSEEAESIKGHVHVAFVEPPVVVDDEPVLIEEKKRKKNKKKEKPILINKNEITPVVDVPPPITNHFEQILPKDDFTLKRSMSREEVEEKPVESSPPSQKQSKPAKVAANPLRETKAEKSQLPKQAQQPQKPVEKIEKIEKTVAPPKPQEKPTAKPQEKPLVQPKPVEEVITKTSAKSVQSAPTAVVISDSAPSTKTGKKKRSEFASLQQMSGEKDAVNVNLLMSLVSKAELSRTEIQVLIDQLLNKQQGSSTDSTEWIEGRQDPMVKLKKQLTEKEKALSEEQEAAVALQSKLRELRNELNTERHSSRQSEARQVELSSLAARLQHVIDEKQQQIQQLQAKLSEEHMMLCKLQEDQGQTQSAMQQELLAQRQQLEMHIARLTEQHQETITAMESQMTQMASQIQEQELVKTSLSGELAVIRERGAHLQDSAAQSQDLARQVKELHSEIERVMSQSQYETGRLQSEVNSLTEQLTLKCAESDKLSSLVQNLQAENNRLTHQISSACVEAKQLRDEKESLAAQVTSQMERPATEGRENGDLSYPETESTQHKVHEKELLVEKLKTDIVSKEKEINHFKTDLAQQESQLSSLKGDLDVARVNAEKMLKEISSYKSLVQEQESVINTLREEGELAHKLVNTLKEDVNKSKTEILRLSKDCATREQLEINTIEKLTSELNTHKTKLADQQAFIEDLQQEVDKYHAKLSDHSREEKLTSELNTYKTELAEKEARVEALNAQLTSCKADCDQLRAELASTAEALTRATQQVKALEDQQASLSNDLEAQKRKNDELRSKNWKAMDALSTTEKILETKVKQSQTLVSEAQDKARLDEQERTKQFLQRLLPHVTVDSKQDYEVWLEQWAGCACGDRGSESESTMLAEVEQQNCQLQAMVTHYKAIIADTEGMLNRLQSHVEQEEGRWGQKIQTLESQLEAVIQERDRLKENSEQSTQLEEALNRNSELNKELTRMKALIHIGEKTVSEQVQESRQLKEQLEALKAGAKNGLSTSTMDGGSDTN